MNEKVNQFLRYLAISLFVTAMSLPLLAAGPTGTIVGTVLDSTGAAIVSARVVVTAPATGFVRIVTSSADGGYVCPLLPVGIYNVSVESAGFKTFEQGSVEVQAEIPSSVFATLSPGTTSEVVTVRGEATQVDTRTGTLRET